MPKILILTGAIPFPLVTGAKIRTFNLLKALSGQFQIDLLTIVSDEKDAEYIKAIENAGINCHSLNITNLSSKFKKGRDAIGSWLFEQPYLTRHYTIPAYQTKLRQLLESNKYDVIHCDSISMTGNLAGIPIEKLILTQHNVEHIIWDGYRSHATGLAQLFYANQFRKVKKLEESLDQIYQNIVTVSESDKEVTARTINRERITVVENGVDPEIYKNDLSLGEKSDVIFTGSLDWHPNIDGLSYYIEDIHPIMKKTGYIGNVNIVGRRPSAQLRTILSSGDGVKLYNDVPAIQPYLNQARVMMVPLRIGGGSRLKILEAMASSLPVVSTSKGAEGLAVTDGEDIIIRDDPQQFAEAIMELLQDDALHDKIASNGLKLVTSRYAWDSVAQAQADLWQRVAQDNSKAEDSKENDA